MNKWPTIKARIQLAIEHGDTHGWYTARNELLGVIGSDYDDSWQPIETAPKDGTEILAWDGYDRFVTSWCTFKDGFGERHTGWIEPDGGELGPCPCEPTHWMSLQDPPRTLVNPMALHAPSSCVVNCGSGEPCDTTRCPLPDPNDPEHQ